MPNDTKINATFMRASSALRGYSKRYGSGDNQRTINVRFVKAPKRFQASHGGWPGTAE